MGGKGRIHLLARKFGIGKSRPVSEKNVSNGSLQMLVEDVIAGGAQADEVVDPARGVRGEEPLGTDELALPGAALDRPAGLVGEGVLEAEPQGGGINGLAG